MPDKEIFVTGASGYIGSRLVPELLDEGYEVRAVSRSPDKLERFQWSDRGDVKLTRADALDPKSLRQACRGCDVAYYLIHSMGQGSGDFEEADRRAARNMAETAEDEGLDRILYLGGHHPEADGELSKHRRSRVEVEEALASGEVPLTTFRAAMVVGSGSASFEMMRYSMERLPSFFITNTYADDPTQPIAVSDVMTYLVGALEHDETIGETYDIGGPDVLTNREVMQTYARVAGLTEPTVVSSSLVPLSMVAWATARLTPVDPELVYPLVLGARHPSVSGDDRIQDVIPTDLLSLEEAMRRSFEKTRREVLDREHDESGPPEWPRPGDPDWSGGTHYEDRRSRTVNATPEELWEAILEIGNRNALFWGQRFRDLVVWLDGYLNVFKFPETEEPDRPLQTGDYLDCWKVLEVARPHRIKLRADVDLPGDPTMEFRLESTGETTELTQIARFRPRGLQGRIYWKILSVFHVFSFPLTLRALSQGAEQKQNK